MSDNETADQKRLRAITDELEAVLKKHDVGGVALLTSRESAAWVYNVPKWTCLMDTERGLYVQLSLPLDTGQIMQTMHFIGCIRDMARDCANIYARIYRVARQQLRIMNDAIADLPEGGRHLDVIFKSN